MDVSEVLQKKSLEAGADWLKKNLKEIKVIYTDVDGTLLGPEGCLFYDIHKNLTLRPTQAIVAALKKKIDIVLVSGRHSKQLRENARLLGFKNYIAEMGTQIIYDQGKKVIFNLGNYRPGERTVFESIKKSGAIDFLFKHYPGKLEDHDPWSQERECTPLFRGLVNVEEANNLLVEAGYPDLKLVDNGRIQRTSPTLKVSEVHAYHLVPDGISKALGVAKDISTRNLEKATTIAIGDAVADLDFASFVGAFFMLRNGLEDNSALAHRILEAQNIFVTEQPVGLGWAEVIEFLLML